MTFGHSPARCLITGTSCVLAFLELYFGRTGGTVKGCSESGVGIVFSRPRIGPGSKT